MVAKDLFLALRSWHIVIICLNCTSQNFRYLLVLTYLLKRR